MNSRQKLIDQDSVIVRLLRDQATPCTCCGELFNAGDRMILPRVHAEALIAIGDARFIADWMPPERRRGNDR